MPICIRDLIEGALNCVENVAEVKKGQDVLILADTTCDNDVIEAYAIASGIVGGNVSTLILDSDIAGASPNEINERGYFVALPKMAWHAMIASDVTLNISNFIEVHSLFGTGQSAYQLDSFMDLVTKHKTRLVRVQIATKEQLASDYAKFPEDLLQYIGIKAYEAVSNAAESTGTENAEVRVFDPLGTDLTFYGFGLITGWRVGGEKTKSTPWKDFGSYNVGLQPAYPSSNAEGRIVSNALHTGPIPPIAIDVKEGKGVSIEGGGAAGNKWRLDWEKKKNVTSEGRHFSDHSQPGINWLEECMYATHPKAFRLDGKYAYEGTLADHSWFTGSRRSGTLHFAFGGGINQEYTHRDLEIFKPTVRINEQPIITEGRLEVLDSIDVREEAKKYGDPDELLMEDWIPDM